ncbi:MAG TPA: glycosyltransferase family 2 protein [Gaiellales bacterium]|jgi:glycosyl transferase family 2|nr:glycosyltransferase family 2 protein [Gaiellales bacterium]
MGDVVVFIPAWNEEASLPAVLDEVARELPEADVLVVDDGSTDATAAVARDHGAAVESFPENRGLRAAIAAGYAYAHAAGYAVCGRVDADGQHPASELRRLIDEVRSGRCDVAVGSRYLTGEDHAPHRYRLEGARRVGTAVTRRAVGTLLRRPFHDPMSGMWAVGAVATELLSRPYTSGAPEVEALLRVSDAGLRLTELPVEMRPRLEGESKLQGRKAVGLVLTVAGTLLVGWRLLRRRR